MAVVLLLRFVFPDLLTAPAFLAWSTVFVAVCLQALPFLVLGVLLSAAISTLVPPSFFERALPRRRALAVPVAGLAGVVLPGCECASVPVAGSLIRRGITPAAALAFLLSAPAINPIVLVATAVAFPGNPEMVLARVIEGRHRNPRHPIEPEGSAHRGARQVHHHKTPLEGVPIVVEQAAQDVDLRRCAPTAGSVPLVGPGITPCGVDDSQDDISLIDSIRPVASPVDAPLMEVEEVGVSVDPAISERNNECCDLVPPPCISGGCFDLAGGFARRIAGVRPTDERTQGCSRRRRVRTTHRFLLSSGRGG